MNPIFSFLVLMAGMVLLIGVIAIGAQWLDGRENSRAIRKKRVLELERTQDTIESIVINTLAVDPHDLTAAQIAAELRKHRTKELKRR